MGNVEVLSMLSTSKQIIFQTKGSVPLSDPASPEDLAEKADIIRKR